MGAPSPLGTAREGGTHPAGATRRATCAVAVPAGRRGALAITLACAWVCALALALAAPRPAHANVPAPQLDVSAAALLSADTGQLLWGRAADAERPIASATKLMTALVTSERVPLGAVFTQPRYYLSPADSQIGLLPGERMTVHDLLVAMLLPSADDAAEDLAYNVGGGSVARFIALMNARARRLGLAHTHYTTPIGLDTPGNYSSAADLARLARYVLAHEPFVRRIVALPRMTLHSGSYTRAVVNRNDLVGAVPWITGVKTGHTLQAGYVLVGAGTRQGMSLVSVVLGTPTQSERDATTLALLRWGFRAFRSVTPLQEGTVVARPAVRGRPRLHPAVTATAAVTRVLPADAPVTTRLVMPRTLVGPLPRGARVGTVRVLVAGRPIASIPAALAVAVPGPPSSLAGAALPVTLLFALLLLLAGGALLRFRRERAGAPAAKARRRR